jgi:hypothetical protein
MTCVFLIVQKQLIFLSFAVSKDMLAVNSNFSQQESSTGMGVDFSKFQQALGFALQILLLYNSNKLKTPPMT